MCSFGHANQNHLKFLGGQLSSSFGQGALPSTTVHRPQLGCTDCGLRSATVLFPSWASTSLPAAHMNFHHCMKTAARATRQRAGSRRPAELARGRSRGAARPAHECAPPAPPPRRAAQDFPTAGEESAAPYAPDCRRTSCACSRAPPAAGGSPSMTSTTRATAAAATPCAAPVPCHGC
jgi:hypothetical protein